MRKLILQMQTSIDMYVATADGDTSWMIWSWGDDWTWTPELQQYHIDTTASADCVLVSDRMAQEGFIDHWSEVATRSGDSQSLFAQNITNARKVIVGKKQPTTLWDNTTFIGGDLASSVYDLKQSPGGNIITFGGAGFARSLIQHDLIDEFHLIVNPVVLGSGLAIFDKLTGLTNLTLESATPYEEGIVVLKYTTVPTSV